MHQRKTISGKSTDQIWQQIGQDITEDTLEYNILIEHNDRQISLDIEIDFGGGFEGGYAETAFVSPLGYTNGFKFAIHREGLTDEIGKFFGMQDVKIGDVSFDARIMVKTNNETLVKQLFSNEQVRAVFLLLEDDFTFGTAVHDHKKVLECSIEGAITDTVLLRSIYEVFYTVLLALEQDIYRN